MKFHITKLVTFGGDDRYSAPLIEMVITKVRYISRLSDVFFKNC